MQPVRNRGVVRSAEEDGDLVASLLQPGPWRHLNGLNLMDGGPVTLDS
jgi:hypothetical protein